MLHIHRHGVLVSEYDYPGIVTGYQHGFIWQLTLADNNLSGDDTNSLFIPSRFVAGEREGGSAF